MGDARCARGTPRISRIASASTSSATLRVLENGALKTGTPFLLRGGEIHLVGADAEAADADQLFGFFEDLGGQLRGGADADECRFTDGGQELLFRQRLRVVFDVFVAVVAEGVHCAGIDAFKEQNVDFVFIERCCFHEILLSQMTRLSRGTPKNDCRADCSARHFYCVR